jgi:hypothetical protein
MWYVKFMPEILGRVFLCERVGVGSSALSLYYVLFLRVDKRMCPQRSGSTSFRYSPGEIVVLSETNAHNSTDPVELWKDWNETTTRMWVRTRDSGKDAYRDPFGLYSLWMKPVMFFKQWCDATTGMWALMVGEVMSSEQLLEANYQFIEVYISMVRDASHLVNEMMFPNRRIPTRPDIAQVAKLVVSLEERVYAIEDALVNFEDGDLKVAPGQGVEGLAGHLECVEGKQDTLDTLSSILQRTEVIGDLAGRLERVEGKLDILLAALEKIEARAYPKAV